MSQGLGWDFFLRGQGGTFLSFWKECQCRHAAFVLCLSKWTGHPYSSPPASFIALASIPLATDGSTHSLPSVRMEQGYLCAQRTVMCHPLVFPLIVLISVLCDFFSSEDKGFHQRKLEKNLTRQKKNKTYC